MAEAEAFKDDKKMKIKRLLSTILCFAMVIGLVPAMSLTASAAVCSGYYVNVKGGNVNMGDEIFLRESAYLQAEEFLSRQVERQDIN